LTRRRFLGKGNLKAPLGGASPSSLEMIRKSSLIRQITPVFGLTKRGQKARGGENYYFRKTDPIK